MSPLERLTHFALRAEAEDNPASGSAAGELHSLLANLGRTPERQQRAAAAALRAARAAIEEEQATPTTGGAATTEESAVGDLPGAGEDVLARAALSLCSEACLLTDRTGVIVAANSAAETLLGEPVDELYGRSIEVFVPADTRPSFHRLLGRVAQSDTTLEYELRLEPPARRALIAALRARRVCSEGGQWSGLCWIGRDIGDERRAQQALRQNEAQLRLLIDHVPALVAYLSADHRFMYANRAYHLQFGDARGAMVGRSMRDVHGDDFYTTARLYLARVLSGQTATFESPVPVGTDDSRWLSVILVPNLGEGPGVSGYFLVAVDVTESRDMQEALRESEARLRGILASAGEGIVTFDDHGRLRSLNPAAERMFGYRADDVLGMSITHLIPPPEGAESGDLSHLLGGLRERCIGQRRECSGRRRDGQSFPLEAVLSQFDDSAGCCYTGVLRDLSEQKRLERAEREHHIQLAHVGRLSTMGEMAAGLAHELNQPLGAIAAYAKAAGRMIRARGEEPPELVQALDRTAEQARRAGSIIGHLRQFVTKRESCRERTDINAVVRSSLSFLENMARERGIAIDYDLASDLPPVTVDAIQIEQVMLNLVKNALDALRQARCPNPVVRVMTRNVDSAAVEVTVADNGPGVDEETRLHLFDPFYTTKPDGMGMGLSISRSLVEAHQGRLQVSSEPGKGASFTFTVGRELGQ